MSMEIIASLQNIAEYLPKVESFNNKIIKYADVALRYSKAIVRATTNNA